MSRCFWRNWAHSTLSVSAMPCMYNSLIVARRHSMHLCCNHLKLISGVDISMFMLIVIHQFVRWCPVPSAISGGILSPCYRLIRGQLSEHRFGYFWYTSEHLQNIRFLCWIWSLNESPLLPLFRIENNKDRVFMECTYIRFIGHVIWVLDIINLTCCINLTQVSILAPSNGPF